MTTNPKHKLVPVEADEKMKMVGAGVLRTTALSSREAAASWAYQSMIEASPAIPSGEQTLDAKINEQITDGAGFWRACSGCQETIGGQLNTKDYPYSETFQCHPGGGCFECGGIGVLWDSNDYSDVGSEPIPSEPSGEQIELETTNGNIATLEHWTENRLRQKPGEAYETLVAGLIREFRFLLDKDEFRVRELIAAGMPATAAPLLAAKDRWQDRAEMAEKALAKLQAAETPEERQAKIVAWLRGEPLTRISLTEALGATPNDYISRIADAIESGDYLRTGDTT